MVNGSNHQALQAAFKNHLTDTKVQVGRLEQIARY
jgi:ferritin-like metal-binding protein YciE